MQQRTTRETGNIGENAVAAFLEKNGYELLERNFTIRGGEIDIIAYKDGCLVFVEVKTRSSGSLESGEKAVTAKKRRFIVRASQVYYDRYREKHGEAVCRFDVAAVELSGTNIKHVSYYVGAFDASGL